MPVLLVVAITVAVVYFLAAGGRLPFLPGWKTFTGDSFTFRYPPSWEMRTPDGGDVFGGQVLAEVYVPGRVSNVRLAVLPSSDPVRSAREFARTVVELYQTDPTERVLVLEGIEARFISGEVVAANGTVLRLDVTLIPHGERLYVFTAACSREDWKRDRPVFEKIVSSFRPR